MTAAPAVERAWICVRGRWVHYLRAGAGPLVILLHGSPQSARAVLPMMQACLARGLSVIAPDTPGNGLSDPLPGAPEAVDAYAAALRETLDALNIRSAAVYGFHTGAAIGAQLAALAPDVVNALVLDGCPVWTDAERADLLAHYLPPFAPHWDGGHLTWLWARLEEQSIFFPWYEQTAAARMPSYGIAAPEAIHANVMDLCKAGDHHRAPYAAAFRFEARAVLSKLVMPTWITASPNDPLFAHLQRLPRSTSRMDALPADRTAALAAMADWLAAKAQAQAPTQAAAGVDAEGETRGYWRLKQGAVGFRGAPDARAFHLLDAGESIRGRRASAGERIIDLPGHGEAGADWVSIPDTVDELAALFDHRDSGRWSGDGLGARVAARISGERDPGPFSDPAPPDLAPRWDGGHLQSAWRYLRRSAIYTRWDAPTEEHWRPAPFNLDAEAMQQRMLDLLLAARHLPHAWRARATP